MWALSGAASGRPCKTPVRRISVYHSKEGRWVGVLALVSFCCDSTIAS